MLHQQPPTLVLMRQQLMLRQIEFPHRLFHLNLLRPLPIIADFTTIDPVL